MLHKLPLPVPVIVAASDYDEAQLEVDPLGPTWEMAWDTSVERTEWETGADVSAVYFVPEPGQFLMLATGSGLLVWLRSRHQRCPKGYRR